MKNFKELLSQNVKYIKEYVPGASIEEIAERYNLDKNSIIKLGSNENPLGASKRAIESIKKTTKNINLYPSYDGFELRKAISEYTNYPIENIVVSGTGMDGIFDTLMRLFISSDDETIIPIPTFSYYEIVTLANSGKPIFVKRDENFDIILDEIFKKINDKTKIIFICSPNNPSGNIVSEYHVRKLLESGKIVFIDEAYVEFSDMSYINLVKEYDNLIIGRTFSKAFGLAGLRLGYAIMPKWILKEYMKVMTPFSVNLVSYYAGIEALKDMEHLTKTIETVKNGRIQLTKALSCFFKVYPSKANFILCDVSPYKASEISEILLKKGIIIRDCSSFRGAGDSLIRITIGTYQQNKKLIDVLKSVL